MRASLSETGIATLDGLLGREIRSFPRFLVRAADAEVHTAGSTRLAHLAGRAMFRGGVVGVHELLGLRPHRQTEIPD